MKNRLICLAVLVAVGLLAACSAIAGKETQPATRVFPTPTYHFLVQENTFAGTPDSPVSLSGAPTFASMFLLQPSATPSPVPSSTPIPKFTATPLPQPQSFTVMVYDDRLNPNWEVLPDTGMDFNLNSSSNVFRGKSAISFVPRVKHKTDYGSLYFTVSAQSREAYPRDQVTVLSFLLYSGDEPLLLDQMAVAVVGSNSQPSWNAKDHSVAVGDQNPVFSETRLYYLDFNRDIPAKTWVPVEVDLDKLTFDPSYKYVTGFYLKTDKGFSRTLSIDDISLEMLRMPPDISTVQVTPSGPSGRTEGQ